MTYSRRQFGRLALTSIPLATATLSNPRLLFAANKPNSKINGVQIGVIAPYSYHLMPSDAKSLLEYIVTDNINAVEIQSPAVEAWAGAPIVPVTGGSNQQKGTPGSGMDSAVPPNQPRQQPSPEQVAARKAHAEELTKWRLSAPMSKFEEFRKWYKDAGVTMYAFKLGLTMDSPDAEIEYAFKVTKALGADQFTMEMPDNQPALTAKIGKFAEKYKIMVGYHAHAQSTPDLWDQAMAQSAYNGINLDVGHYVQGGNHDVLAFIKKNHVRITSMHMKDRKYPDHDNGDNTVWGKGDTPLKEILQLMKKEGYKFPATIELEYVPLEGADSVKEVARCLDFCKAALA